MQRNNYIVGRTFRNFLMASILTSIVQQMRVLVDGIIVGHLIGPMALSAINLYLPLEETVYGIIMLFTAGAGFLAACRQSRHDYEGVSSQFTVALTSGMCVVVTLVTMSFVFFPELIDLLADADEPVLCQYTAEYTQVLIVSFLIQVPNSVLRSFIGLDGHPQLVTRSIIVSFLLNIVLDFCFVGFMDMGIAGAAWATLISDTFGFFMLLPYTTGHSCSFSLTSVKHYATEQRESLQEGFPLALGGIMTGVVVMITNQVVLEFEGTNGVFIFAVIFQIQSLCGMVAEGLSEICESIGGVYKGEKDNSSFRALIYKCYQMLWGVLVGVCLLALVVPDYFMMLFGEEAGHITSENLAALRVGSLLVLPYVMVSFTSSVHTLVGYELLSTVMLILQSVVMVVSPYVVTAIYPELFWWSYPIGAALVVSLQVVVPYLIHLRKRQSTEIALMPTLPDAVSMDYSLPYDETTIDQSLMDAAQFLKVCELDPQLRADVFVCCHDIAYNILAYSSDNNKGHYFDLRMQDDDGTLDIWLKDAGKPYNPAQGLVIPDNVDIRHKYMFGLNVTSLRINLREQQNSKA